MNLTTVIYIVVFWFVFVVFFFKGFKYSSPQCVGYVVWFCLAGCWWVVFVVGFFLRALFPLHLKKSCNSLLADSVVLVMGVCFSLVSKALSK